MRHERGIQALDLHPIIECLVETRLAWQLSVSDIAARMGPAISRRKGTREAPNSPAARCSSSGLTCSDSNLSCGTRSQLPLRQSAINLRIVP